MTKHLLSPKGVPHVHLPWNPCGRSDLPRVPDGVFAFTEPHDQVDYLLSDEALQAGSVTVQEVSRAAPSPI